MSIIKVGIGEILPDSVLETLRRKFGKWTEADQAELDAELEADELEEDSE